MRPVVEIVQGLSDPVTPIHAKRDLAASFSHEFGWRPNDLLDVPNALPAANLVVEHGLDNAAMLSFLPSNRTLQNVRTDEWRSILGLSYNSLIDWHICIDQATIRCFYNRSDPPKTMYSDGFDQSDYSALTRRKFEEAIGLVPNPNVLALDGALLNTISMWKRLLRVELGEKATPSSISALFNGIILARAVEDFNSRKDPKIPNKSLRERVAIPNVGIVAAIEDTICDLTRLNSPSSLFDRALLEPFDELSDGSTRSLIDAFCRHDRVPYNYDFSIMSKYALSKIYERYVSVMQHQDAVQSSMFPLAHEESWNKLLGGIYTPQYIASFFARYLRNNLPSQHFVNANVVDPACGSGVFLRAVMEQKLLASQDFDSKTVQCVLESLLGVDIDENAVAAARLSLALLYLATNGQLPKDLPIFHDDSLNRFAPPSQTPKKTFDAVMVNPPFVRTELQSIKMREAISKHAGGIAKGKLDTYVAFLVVSISALRPGGFACFVVPQTLLTSENLKPLRDWIQQRAWVKVIADLSAIRVFEASVYVVLLIVQRKSAIELNEPPISFIRCQRDVGLALDDFLDGNHRITPSYSIFDAPQRSLSRSNWSVTTPEETRLMQKLDALPRLGDLASVRQGAITGADKIFILGADEVPPGEEAIYKQLLPDREIGRYSLPSETGLRIFYPYVDGIQVDVTQLANEFPRTWDRLNRQQEFLRSRNSVSPDGSDWWRPWRPRPPDEMLAPKIVMPAVSLIPRFGVDLSGQSVVSHSPFVFNRAGETDVELLLILAAVLNSSVISWFIDLNASKYARGYNRMNVSLLRRIPIPELNRASNLDLQQVVNTALELVNLNHGFNQQLASKLDDVILRELYMLSDEEIKLVKPQSLTS